MGRRSQYSDEFSVAHAIGQILLICMVFYLWSSPVIQPVKIMVVLFHEMSHGLMALLSGGQVLDISITADEGGSCETDGGVAILIVSAGYLGSMLWGGLLLYLSRFKHYVPGVYIALTLALTTAIFTVLREPFARTFATGLAATFIVLGLLAPALLGAIFLRILGTVGCLYSLFDIYWDVLATNRPGYSLENDAAAFARLTGTSAELVGMVWLGLSVVFFLAVLKVTVTTLPDSAARGAAASAAA